MHNRKRWLVVGTVMVLLLAIPLAALATHRFTDVRHSNSHNKGIEFVADAGITIGCNAEGTKFCPADLLRRDQMATFLFRTSGWDPKTGPVVFAWDSVLSNGQLSGSGHEAFTLDGDVEAECKAAVPVGWHNSEVSLQHQLVKVPAGGNPALVNVSLNANRTSSSGAYEVCFARVDGENLVGGVYDTNVSITLDVLGFGMDKASAEVGSARVEAAQAALDAKIGR